MTRLRRILLLLAALALPLAPLASSAADTKLRKAPPVAVVIKGEKYEVRALEQTNLQSLTKLGEALVKGGSVSQSAGGTPDSWIECGGELCYCVGEDDCAEMVGFYCRIPPGTQCNILSDGSLGCSCLRGRGGAPSSTAGARFEMPEFIWP